MDHSNSLSENQVPPEVLTLLRERLKHLKYRSKRNGRRCDLTLTNLVKLYQQQRGMCALTGRPMSLERGSADVLSVDRVDSADGYTAHNTQLTVFDANRRKQDRLIVTTVEGRSGRNVVLGSHAAKELAAHDTRAVAARWNVSLPAQRMSLLTISDPYLRGAAIDNRVDLCRSRHKATGFPPRRRVPKRGHMRTFPQCGQTVPKLTKAPAAAVLKRHPVEKRKPEKALLPPVTVTAREVANACGRTPQAVTSWVNNGVIVGGERVPLPRAGVSRGSTGRFLLLAVASFLDTTGRVLGINSAEVVAKLSRSNAIPTVDRLSTFQAPPHPRKNKQQCLPPT